MKAGLEAQAPLHYAPDDYVCTLCDDKVAPAAWAAEFLAVEDAEDLYCTWSWFDNLSQYGLDTNLQRLWVKAQPRDGGPALCLPLLVETGNRAALWGPAVTALSNYYSSLFGPAGDDRALTVSALRAIIRTVARHGAPCSVFDIQPLDAHSRFFHCMQAALKAEGYLTGSYFCFGNWHLPVQGRNFSAYAETLPSRIKNTMKRGRKKLEDTGNWTLNVHSAPGEALEAGIADFVAIYAKSWKLPEPHPFFVPNLCRRAAASNWLRLGVVRIGSTPVAAQLWIVKSGRALIYKLAYDEEFKRYSAGSVLSGELMRRAIDVDHVDEVDYLTGDDEYKRDWMSHRRERVGLVAFKQTSLVGMASAARHWGGAVWRRRKMLKTTPPAPAPGFGSVVRDDDRAGGPND